MRYWVVVIFHQSIEALRFDTERDDQLSF